MAWLWERLSGWQQDQVEVAAKAELAQLAGLGVAPEGAPRLLADRLAETGGEAMVTSPYGWLIRRGLPQRPACSHRKCDDGIRLDTGEDCENCGNVIHLRRARRARIGADIDRELPGLSDGERRRVLEERLREQAALEAEGLARRQAQARAERARRDAARPAAAEQAERDRQAAAAADAIRQTLACEDCGRGDVAALEADPQAAADAYAFTAFQAAQQAVGAYHAAALAVLGRTQEAEAEARRAFRSEQGRPWFRPNPTGADAVAAATRAAGTARERVAEYLLAARLEQLREQTAAGTEQAGSAPWADPAARDRRAPAGPRCRRGGDRMSVELSGVDSPDRPWSWSVRWRRTMAPSGRRRRRPGASMLSVGGSSAPCQGLLLTQAPGRPSSRRGELAVDRTNGSSGEPPQEEEGDVPDTGQGTDNGHEPDEDPGLPSN